MMLLLMQWPFKKYISKPIRLYDGSAVLKFRQIDIQTLQTIRIFGWKITHILRVVSSVLCNGLQINTLISRCKQTWAGGLAHVGGGVAGDPWPALDSKITVSERAWWAFRWWLQPGGRGLKYACAPPPPRRIARRPPKARVGMVLRTEHISKENIFYAVRVRVIDVSMVIAAWGEGVGPSVSPSPSSDRS